MVAQTMEPQSCNHNKNDEWFVSNRKALQMRSPSKESQGSGHVPTRCS